MPMPNITRKKRESWMKNQGTLLLGFIKPYNSHLGEGNESTAAHSLLPKV